MSRISLKERIDVNHQLKKLGFGGIHDPNLFSQIATLYSNHDSFRGLLMSTAPDQRRVAYESLKPHLSFTPKPLDAYEMEIKEKAEREQWDIWDGTAYPKPFKVGEVESPEYRLDRVAQEVLAQNAHEKAGGVLEYVCSKCTFASQFPAKTRKQAQAEAHSKGWRWAERNGTMKCYCPTHVPGRLTMTLQCSECPRQDSIRAWDEQDGYASARLSGWVIEDAAKCPRCSVKLVTLQ